MKINNEFFAWAMKMNSKQFHECSKREKNECPIRVLKKPQYKVLMEIQSYHCLPKIRSAHTVLAWAMDHDLVVRHLTNKSLDLTNAGTVLLSLFEQKRTSR